MLRFLLSLSLLFLPLCVVAQRRPVAVPPVEAEPRPLSSPLAYVAADSIVVWGGGSPDLRAAALAVSASLRSHAVGVGQADVEGYASEWRRWATDFAPHINLSGSLGAEGGGHEVEDAVRTLDAAARLLLLTGDARFADAAERALWGALSAEVATPRPLTFERHVAAQALMDGMGLFYATDADGLYVNFYLNSSAHIATPHFDFVLDQMTSMPFDGLVKLRLTGLGPGRHRLKLRLRVPAWALRRTAPACAYRYVEPELPLPVVYVNGREPLRWRYVQGYVEIDREWITGDEVYFVLPTAPAWVARSSGGAERALMVGPLLHAATAAAAATPWPADSQLLPADSVNGRGNPLWLLQAPATAARPAVTLSPYMDDRGPVWLPFEPAQ